MATSAEMARQVQERVARITGATDQQLIQLRGAVARDIDAGFRTGNSDRVQLARHVGAAISAEMARRAAVLAATAPPADPWAGRLPGYSSGQLDRLRRELVDSRRGGSWSDSHQRLWDGIGYERGRRAAHAQVMAAVRGAEAGRALARGLTARRAFEGFLASTPPPAPSAARARADLAQTLADRVHAATDAQLTAALPTATGQLRELIVAEMTARKLIAVTGDEETR